MENETKEISLEEMRGRLTTIEERILNACALSNRARASVRLIWVSKFHSKALVENAISLGAQDFGENRVQEAEQKFSTPLFTPDLKPVQCHIIGPVQSNKLKKAAKVASSIHSIANLSSVEKLERLCAEMNKTLDILFQVNAGKEETKSGLEISSAKSFLENLPECPHLRYRGLMTIGKNTDDPEDSRECFSFLKNLRDQFFKLDNRFQEFSELSMGMTNDLEVAIEEGATMIRIGTALFGERH